MGKRKTYAALSVIVLIVACLPLFTVNCIGGHDISYHLLRIEALKTAILSGRPFLRINMLFFGGMGYASSLFYPDFLLYIPALLRVMGVGINLSYNLFVAFCIIAGFASAFYCARHVSKSDYAGLVTAVIFTLYQYHIYDIYTRAAVGEFTAFIFIPFVIAGLYDLLHEEFKKPVFLIIGMTGVTLCHTITTVICLILCLVALAAGIKNVKRDPMILLRVFLCGLLVMGLTAFYWVPVLEMVSTGVFSSDFVFDTAYEAVKVWEIPYNEYNRMGAAVLILLLTFFPVKKKDSFGVFCLITGLVLTFITTTLFPWARLKGIADFIQFPWRIFIITGPLFAFAEGIFIKELAGEIREGKEERDGELAAGIILIAVISLMTVSAVQNTSHDMADHYSYSSDYFEYKPYTAEVIGGEWLPVACEDRDALVEMSDKAVTDTGAEADIRRYKNEIYIDDVPSDTAYLDVPFIFYKGYAASDADTGAYLLTDGSGRSGTVRVYTDGTRKIRVYYRGTAIQHVSDALSACLIIGLLAYFIFCLVRRKKEAPHEEARGI